MHVVVAYDVVDDRRRTRLADRLTELLHRVQKSVFEGDVDASGLEAVYQRIMEETNLEEDSVLVLRLCRGCLASADYLGVCKNFAPPASEDQVV